MFLNLRSKFAHIYYSNKNKTKAIPLNYIQK